MSDAAGPKKPTLPYARPQQPRPAPTPAMPDWSRADTLRRGFFFGVGLWLAWLLCSVAFFLLTLLLLSVSYGLPAFLRR
jgi:hypothetical protein